MGADPLWITEQDVVNLLDLPAAIRAVEGALRAEASGEVTSMSKAHLLWGQGHTLHAIGAVDESQGLVATKTWAHTGGGATPLLIVWDSESGGLRAIIEAFALGQLRTGAMSGVATSALAAPDAQHLAVIGSGKQALPQAAAVTAVRPIRRVSVFSPTEKHRDAFAATLAAFRPDLEVISASSVVEAVRDAQVVTAVTRAREPFLRADMLAPGTHVNALGAVTPERRELAPDVLAGARVVTADSLDAAWRLAVELEAVEEIVPLCRIVASGEHFVPGDGFTVFKAMGVGLADLALGGMVLTRAMAGGLGRLLPVPERAVPQLKEMS